MQYVMTCGACGFTRAYPTAAQRIKGHANHTQNKHRGVKVKYTDTDQQGDAPPIVPGQNTVGKTPEQIKRQEYQRRYRAARKKGKTITKRKYTRRQPVVQENSGENLTPLMIRHCPGCGFNIELINRAAIMALKFK